MKTLLFKIQKITLDLNVEKLRYDSKCGFAYRSIEDIYKELKPLLEKYKISIDFIEDIHESSLLKCTATIECLTSGDKKAFSTLIREVKNDDYDSLITSYTFAKKSLLTTIFMLDDAEGEAGKGDKIKRPTTVSIFFDDLMEKINDGEVGAIKRSFDLIPQKSKSEVWDMLDASRQKLIRSLA